MTLVLAATTPGPEDRAVLADDTGRAVAVVSRLPESQRRALVLAALGGRTAREIGEIDGVPLGTAKTRIRTALQQVRAALAEDEAPRDCPAALRIGPGVGRGAGPRRGRGRRPAGRPWPTWRGLRTAEVRSGT